MKKTFLVSLTALLLAGSAARADVSGVWSLRLTTSDGESAPRASVTLKQGGDRLTGSCVIGDTEQEFTVVGQVTDNAVKGLAVREQGARRSILQRHDQLDRA